VHFLVASGTAERETGDVGQRIEVDLRVGVESQKKVSSAFAVLLQSGDFSAQKRPCGTEYDDDGGVLRDLPSPARSRSSFAASTTWVGSRGYLKELSRGAFQVHLRGAPTG